MKKIVNTAHIEGRVYSHTLKESKVTNEQSKYFGQAFISGVLSIATDDAKTNIIDVRYGFCQPKYKNGNPNKTYEALAEIIKKNLTVENSGDAAMCVSCSPAIAINDFWVDREGKEEHIEAKRLEGGFVNIIQSSKLNKDESARNTFEVDMLINGVKDVEPKEGSKDAPYIMIEGFTFAFNGAILPVSFAVKSKAGINYFNGKDISKENRLFTKIWGNIKNSVVTTQRENDDEAAFGEIKVREFTKNVRTWEVSTAAKNSYEIGDAETGLTLDEVKKALQDREVYLADQKKRSDDYKAKKGGAATGTSPKKEEFDF